VQRRLCTSILKRLRCGYVTLTHASPNTRDMHSSKLRLIPPSNYEEKLCHWLAQIHKTFVTSVLRNGTKIMVKRPICWINTNAAIVLHCITSHRIISGVVFSQFRIQDIDWLSDITERWCFSLLSSNLGDFGDWWLVWSLCLWKVFVPSIKKLTIPGLLPFWKISFTFRHHFVIAIA